MDEAQAETRKADGQPASRALAADFDLKKLTAAFLEDPYPTYRALRESDPIHRMPDGSFFLSRYDDCLAVYRDTETWSSDKKLDFKPNFADSPLYEHHTTKSRFQRSALSHAGAQAAGAGFYAARLAGAGNPHRIAGRSPARCRRRAGRDGCRLGFRRRHSDPADRRHARHSARRTRAAARPGRLPSSARWSRC